MKRQAFILILTLTLFAGKAAAQCVDAGPVMSAICQGGTSAPLGGIFYGDAAGPVWSDGGVGGTFSPNENDLNATWKPPAGFNGTATLTLTASSGSCTPLSASKQIAVNASPVPTITGDASDCAGTTGVNYTTETGMAGYTWTITAGGTITNGSGTKKITVTWNTAGAQTVSVNYTGGNGCSAPSPTVYSVTVNPLPVPTITGPATAGVGSTGNVYTTESGMTGYNWTISSGGTITGGSGTNSITVTWNNSGAKTVKVNYTDGNGCTAVTATVFNVTVSNSAPVASNVSILGDPRSGLTLYASYVYSDAEGDDEGTSLYQWYTGTSSGGAGAATISLATSITYKLTDAQLGKYIGFSVTPVALTGSSPGIIATTVVWAGPVINDPPVASAVSVTGSLNVNGVLTGHYTYSDKEGDIESGSAYQWYSATSIGGTYSAIPLETTINHIIAMGEQGMYFKFYVTPKAATGSLTGATNSSAAFGPANSKPYADNVTVTGTASLGNTLTGHYNYHDADSDPEGTSKFQWYRETTAIPGATSLTYILTSDDVDSRMKFEVTPVSSTGFPDTGNPVQSSFTGVVIDPSATLPAATDVCISGTRAIGQQLTGKYKYVNTYDEQGSIYLWLRGNTVIESGTTNSYTKYTLTSADLNQEIKYAVIPRNKRSQVGDTVFSQTLAIFTLPRLAYSIADSSVVLTADPAGGIFYGQGVSNGEFFPSYA